MKEQLKTIKNNWLIILVSIALIGGILLVGSNNLGSDSVYSYEKSYESDYSSWDTTSADYNYEPMSSASSGTYEEYAQSSSGTGDVLKDERKITTTTDITTEVEQGEFLEAEQKLKSIVTASDSLLLEENVGIYGEEKKEYHDGTYTIKVESSKLDAVVTQLKEVGIIQSFTQTKEDITEPYKNLEIEINAEKQRLAQYQQILKEAEKVEDKIKLNNYIFDQEREIEYLEDALKNADKQVVYGTIYMRVIEKEPAYADMNEVKGSELLVGFVNSVVSVIYVIVVAFPYAVVIVLIWLAIRWMRKRSAKKR